MHCYLQFVKEAKDVAKTSGSGTDSSTDLEGTSSGTIALVPKELGAPAKKKLLVLSINGILADIVSSDYGYSHLADINFNHKSGKKLFSITEK
jgi:hypothetical protein